MASPNDTQGGAEAPRQREIPTCTTSKTDLASAKLLKELTEMIVTAPISSYDDPQFLRHMSPDYQWNIVGIYLGHGRDAHFQTMREIRQANPNYHVEVLNLSADVHFGRAKTWALMNITGFPDGVERESLLVFSWRRDKHGIWVAYKHDSMRGVAPMPLISDSTPQEDQ